MPMGDNIREEEQAKVDGLRAVNRMLREQNRVLRSNLVNCVARLEAYYGEDYPAVRDAKAALTATSQPEPCTNHFSDGSKIFPSRDCCKPATSQEGQG